MVLASGLVESLGDVLPDCDVFVPMGVTHEIYDTPGFRDAAAGGNT